MLTNLYRGVLFCENTNNIVNAFSIWDPYSINVLNKKIYYAEVVTFVEPSSHFKTRKQVTSSLNIVGSL